MSDQSDIEVVSDFIARHLASLQAFLDKNSGVSCKNLYSIWTDKNNTFFGNANGPYLTDFLMSALESGIKIKIVTGMMYDPHAKQHPLIQALDQKHPLVSIEQKPIDNQSVKQHPVGMIWEDENLLRFTYERIPKFVTVLDPNHARTTMFLRSWMALDSAQKAAAFQPWRDAALRTSAPSQSFILPAPDAGL